MVRAGSETASWFPLSLLKHSLVRLVLLICEQVSDQLLDLSLLDHGRQAIRRTECHFEFTHRLFQQAVIGHAQAAAVVQSLTPFDPAEHRGHLHHRQTETIRFGGQRLDLSRDVHEFVG